MFIPFENEKSDFHNKRKHERITYCIDDGIVGSFAIPAVQKEAITAYILNLSKGGLHFTLRKEDIGKLKEGDQLFFMEIKKWASFRYLVNIDAEIKWIDDDHSFPNIGLGCQFLKISQTSKEHISEFLKSTPGNES